MTETAPETIFYTADVVCVRGDDVLLIERGWPPHQGKLALPGGHVDEGETSREAAVRELLEETGVKVPVDDLVLVGVYDAPGRDPRGRYVSVAYLARVPADTIARAGTDATAVRWAPLNDPGDDLAFDHGLILRDAGRQLGDRDRVLEQLLAEVRELRPEPWPEDVFARYTTLAGAHVDLFRAADGWPQWRCAACPATSVGAYTGPFNDPFGDTEIHRQAQDHAARCRALPKP
ncbi:NUDIX domain-containing protein [Streptomyces sp. NPDC059477]|uniref:NUDIX domain-containing protein n=1 Tax=Streptomyces sp. NPDC059477 TaxID=3346847 RepID=UPI0036D04F18